MSNLATTTIRKDCPECGEAFDATQITVMGVTVQPSLCDLCADSAWTREKRKLDRMAGNAPARETREQAWQRVASQSGFRRFLGFNPGFVRVRIPDNHGGLLFAGATGMGKTFLAVELLRRRFMAGATVALVDGIAFGFDVSTEDSKRREDALDRAIKADWLLFDDLGKAKVTPRVAEALFHLANQRENFERPTIWTTNASDAELRDRLPVEMRDPFLERIGRTTETVFFH